MGLFRLSKINKSKNNSLTKVYQQSVDILESIVENFLTAGIIDLTDNSYTVLKDMTHKTQMHLDLSEKNRRNSNRILLYSYDVTKEYEGNALLSEKN